MRGAREDVGEVGFYGELGRGDMSGARGGKLLKGADVGLRERVKGRQGDLKIS